MPVKTIVTSIRFQQDCAGYLKQAADANSVELAAERLDKAIEYIEAHELTEGYTSILWKTESDNIGFWYENLKVCQKELAEAVGASQLEKTNVLMKIRESLTDNGDDGTRLTIPGGINRYPHNGRYAALNLISVLLLVIGSGLITYYFD